MKNPTDLVVEVIEQFLEQQSNLPFLNNFDGAMRGREQRLPAQELDSPTTQLAWRSQFTKARTHGEAVEMVYRYLQQEKLRFIGRQTKAVEDGFLFEVCQTNEGPVWFKTKTQWP